MCVASFQKSTDAFFLSFCFIWWPSFSPFYMFFNSLFPCLDQLDHLHRFSLSPGFSYAAALLCVLFFFVFYWTFDSLLLLISLFDS